MCEYASCLAFFLHLSLQCILWNKVFLVWKLYWSCSAFEMIICCTRLLSAKFGHSDYIILTFKADFVSPNCSDFIISSYLNAPEALKVHTNVFFLCIIMTFSVHCYKHPHLTWPILMPYSTHLDQNHFLMMEIVAWNIPLSENSLSGVWFWGNLSHFSLDHDVLSQAHIVAASVYILNIISIQTEYNQTQSKRKRKKQISGSNT